MSASPASPPSPPSPPSPRLAGWGRVFGPGRAVASDDLLAASQRGGLVRGLGRSYGDSALPAPDQIDVIATPASDRILAFNEAGVLRAEAGLSLFTLNRLLLPRGYFVPVTPGTQYVTLGGMVASDVHGKNHHVAGTIGRHLLGLRMRVADGRVIDCSPAVHEDLFWATVGGMGLTGAILEVELRLDRVPTPWIQQELTRHRGLDSLIAGLTEASAHWPMTLAWIDCLKTGPAMGRGVLYAGRWATPQEAPSSSPAWSARTLPVPFEAPSWLLSPASVRLFNAAVYARQYRRHSVGIVRPETFFYPLDVVANWNLAYGKRGFTQHQAVIPRTAGGAAVRHFLKTLTSTSAASFLCVMKDCGPQGQGMLSFPMEGTSIAIDLPVRDDTVAVVARLNAVVREVGGRIYLTKDRFTTAADFRAMEPRLDDFLAVRARWDPAFRYRSAQSVRMLGDPAIGPARSDVDVSAASEQP